MQQCGVVESTHVESSRSSLIGRFMACKSRLEDDCKSGAIRRNPVRPFPAYALAGIKILPAQVTILRKMLRIGQNRDHAPAI